VEMSHFIISKILLQDWWRVVGKIVREGGGVVEKGENSEENDRGGVKKKRIRYP